MKQCDILFLSHNHSDHVDPVVVDYFLQEGKSVVAPDEVLPANKQVKHIREERIIERSFPVRNGQLRVQILPGHQDALQNNIYVVKSPEGYTFAQTGDQYLRYYLIEAANSIRLHDPVFVPDKKINIASSDDIDVVDPEWLFLEQVGKVGFLHRFVCCTISHSF